MSIRDYLTKRLTQGNNNDPHTKGSNTKKMNKVLDDKGMSIEKIPDGDGVKMPMVDTPLVDKKPGCCCAKGDGSNVVKKFIKMKYVEPKLVGMSDKPAPKSPTLIKEFTANGEVIKLKEPMSVNIKLSDYEEFYIVESDNAIIDSYALLDDDVDELIQEELSVMWEFYATADDSTLSKSAKELKYQLLNLVE